MRKFLLAVMLVLVLGGVGAEVADASHGHRGHGQGHTRNADNPGHFKHH